MTERLGVAVIGLGRMGRFHAESIRTSCPSIELVCVSDLDEGRGRTAGQELGVPFVQSADDVIASREVDAVVVATASATHSTLSAQAAESGKHVFCEKPIALDRETTLWTMEHVEATGVVFQVGLHRRSDPDWVLAAKRVHDGDLGDPYFFRASLRDMTSPPASFLTGSGGLFLDVTLHDLDVARWFVGEVVQVTAIGAALSDPALADVGDVDTAVVTLRFESGALGVIDNSRSAGYGYESSTEVVGSRASLWIDNAPVTGVEWRTPGALTRVPPADFTERYPRAYPLELEAFAATVLHGAPLRASGWDALAAFDLGSAAALSFRTGSPVVTHPERTAAGVRYEQRQPR